MRIPEKFRYALSVFTVAVWVLFIVIMHIACSSARKAVSESSNKVDSVAVEASFSSVAEVDVTEQSKAVSSLMADSVKLFQMRFAPESSEPPDFRTNYLPAYAASLYGVKLANFKDCSSSLGASVAVRDSSASSAISRDSCSKESISEKAEPKATPVHWCIIFFLLGALAVLMAIKFFDKQ